MKTKKIVVIENAEGQFLSVLEYGDEREFIWVNDLTDVDRSVLFETWETKNCDSVLEQFPTWMYSDLTEIGAKRAKFATYKISYKKVG